MWAAIAATGTLLLFFLKIGIYFYKKNTKKSTYEDDKQKMEDAIARGNAADITAMFDDVRRPPDKNNIGGQGDKTTP